MSESNVLTFMENGGISMTIDEGLAFIERSRRQLARAAVTAAEKDMHIDPEFEAEMRSRLDKLEVRLLYERSCS